MNGEPPVLLVVDDDPNFVQLLRRLAERWGYDVVTCGSGQAALDTLRRRRADVALIDLHMPEVNGLEVLRAVRDADPTCQAILMTGYASQDAAVEAVKLGARDYLSKPIDLSRLESLLSAVRSQGVQRQTILDTEADLARRLEFHGMIGRSPAMQELFELVRRLAPHVRTAVISGEQGTGKELLARALHAAGPRADRPFVTVRAEVLTDQGHAAGFLASAEAGTLLIDEVTQLVGPVQAWLSGQLADADRDPARCAALPQVLATSSRDLRAEVASGHFRADLLQLLCDAEFVLPALRDRREDIPYLTSAFLQDAGQRLGKPVRGLTTAAEAMIAAAGWDGNVRQLEEVVDRACDLADGDLITDKHIASCLPEPPPAAQVSWPRPATREDGDLLSTVEREHIMRALQRTGGNKKAAARMLGVSRRALYRRLERLDLGTTIARRKGHARDDGEKATA